MPADPVLGAYTYRVYVRAHYNDNGRPLYNTLYIAKTHGPASPEDLDIAVGIIMEQAAEHYKATCANNVTFDPIQVRSVIKPAPVLYEGPAWRSPIGQGGAPGPRAMSVNMVIKPEHGEGRSQHNRMAQFGVPLDQIATGYHDQYAPLFVAQRIIFLTFTRDLLGDTNMFLAVYSPLTNLTYIAHTIYEPDVTGTRETRMPGHKAKR